MTRRVTMRMLQALVIYLNRSMGRPDNMEFFVEELDGKYGLMAKYRGGGFVKVCTWSTKRELWYFISGYLRIKSEELK